MKKALSFLAQFVLFLATFAAGMIVALFDPLRLRWFITHPTPTTTRYFTPDGLILMMLLYALILLIEAWRGKLRMSAPRTTIAFVLAMTLGFLLKFGFAS